MTPVKARPRKRPSPVTQATEPRSYDRSFYARTLLASFVVIVLALGFAIYNFAFKTESTSRGPSFDLSSLFIEGAAGVPDPSNPCIALQEHLEATRKGLYEKAYGYLSEGLRKTVSLEEFVSNAKNNSLLFRDIDGYEFPGYKVDGAAASVGGYIKYGTGGHSRVEAEFAREGEAWKVSRMNMVYR